MKLSIIIPTLQAAASLPNTLQCLTKNSLEQQPELIVVDGGSTDNTLEIAKNFSVRCLEGRASRGIQLATGAACAKGDWLLFLHADTHLDEGWDDVIQNFITTQENQDKASVFTFALDDDSIKAICLEKLVSWRTRWFGLPYGDQGLLISRKLYLEVGGYQPVPIMEDISLVRRIPQARLIVFPVRAISSAVRWQRDGWFRRSFKNLSCLLLYFVGVSSERILRFYR